MKELATIRSTTVDKLVEQIKLLTGKMNDDLIKLLVEKTKCELEMIIKKAYDTAWDNVIVDIVVVKLNKQGNEGLNSTSVSGMSDNYLDGYPKEIRDQLLAIKGRVKIL